MDKGYDVLLLTEAVDEFCLQVLRTYPRKDAEGKDGIVEFKNVNSGDLGLETEAEKKAAEDATSENKSLFDAMKDALDALCNAAGNTDSDTGLTESSLPQRFLDKVFHHFLGYGIIRDNTLT